jgi:hypothetical protein
LQFRWPWQQQLRPYPLRLQRWRQRWLLPRWWVRFHLRLWLQLALLSLRLSLLQLWQRHQWQQ